jgi:hypothetical protein
MKKINLGDKFKVVACYYNVPDWTEGSPCVILEPCLRYDEGSSIESVVEDFLIDTAINKGFESENEEIVDSQLKWAGTSLRAIRRNAYKTLKTCKSTYKSIYFEVVSLEVEVVSDTEVDGLDIIVRKKLIINQ